MLVGIFSSWFLVSLLDFDDIVKNSLLVCFILIFFVLVFIEKVGGFISLILLFIVIIGLVGMLLGDFFLFWIKYKNYFVLGVVLGNVVYVMGIVWVR